MIDFFRKLFAKVNPVRREPLDIHIYRRLREWGMPAYIAEAFMDSFVAGSRLEVAIDEEHPLVEGSRGGKGLYQLTGSRRRAYEARYDDWTADNQLDFLFWELKNTERKAWAVITRTRSRPAAVHAITRYFLRPAVDNSEHRIGVWSPSRPEMVA